jgi:hypothetical protein
MFEKNIMCLIFKVKNKVKGLGYELFELKKCIIFIGINFWI